MVDLVKRVVLLIFALILLLSGTFRVRAQGVHDVAVVDVTYVLPYGATEVFPDWKVNISVTVRNEGDFNETFNVTAYANSTAINTKTVTDLAPSENETLTFIWTAPGTAWWDDVYGWILSPANYTIRAEVDIVGGETDINDNVLVDGSVKVRIPGDVDGNDYVDFWDLLDVATSYKTEYPYYDWRCDFTGDGVIDGRDLGWLLAIHQDTNIIPAVRDVAIADASVAIPWEATEVYPDWLLNITVVTRNWGNTPETFTITGYCNTTAIGTQTVTLAVGEKKTLTLTGNTTDVTPSATAYPIKVSTSVIPDEYDAYDNTFTDGTIKVRLPGDVDGDGDVDFWDLLTFCKTYGGTYPSPPYNPNADFDGDGDVDFWDLLVFCKNYGTSVV